MITTTVSAATTVDVHFVNAGFDSASGEVTVKAPGLRATAMILWSPTHTSLLGPYGGPATVTVDGDAFGVIHDATGVEVMATRGRTVPQDVTDRVVAAFDAARTAFVAQALTTPAVQVMVRRRAESARVHAEQAAVAVQQWQDAITAIESTQQHA